MTTSVQDSNKFPATPFGNVRLETEALAGEALPEPGHFNSAEISEDEESHSELDTEERPLTAGISTLARRSSFIDEDQQPIASTIASAKAKSGPPATWMSLPKKDQLAVLTLARLSEPLAERSLSAYMFYQLKFFDPSLPDSTISSQGGFLMAAFALAQFMTAVWWGRAADSEHIGRKKVLLIGLTGTCMSSLGVGFSNTYTQALCWRFAAGALNGNVGVMRTMVSEIIKEKKFQSRAFLMLPMCFNVGIIIGPILGGFLADPIASFPSAFGPGSKMGGKDGVGWMTKWPYALPNIFSAGFILMSALAVVLGLDETHPARKHKTDYGRKLWKSLLSIKSSRDRYTQLNESDTHTATIDLEELPHTPARPLPPGTPDSIIRAAPDVVVARPKPKILTRNVVLTLFSQFLLALHISSFNALIFILLPTPRPDYTDPSTPPARLPFFFSGGLNMPSSRVGLTTAIIGVVGIPLQILLYPRLQSKLGTVAAYRYFLPFSPLAYTLLPYLTLLPAHPAVLWPAITIILCMQVMSRTFTLPSGTILVNNSAPDQRVLGSVHGLAQSVSAGARTLGPVVGGWCLGWGLRSNMIGAVWWGMAVVACLNWALLWVIKEGPGGSAGK